MFDRYHRSLAVMTSVKYGCDSEDLTGTLQKPEIYLAMKLTNGALATPDPEWAIWQEKTQGLSATKLIEAKRCAYIKEHVVNANGCQGPNALFFQIIATEIFVTR